MVVTKVFQIKEPKNLINAIKYITNEEKTLKDMKSNEDETNTFPYVIVDGQAKIKLVSGQDIINAADAETIYDDFIITKAMVDAYVGNLDLSDIHNPNRVMAHHIIQSFSPDDNLTPEEVHEIGRKTILELTGGNHQFVIATHIDQDHLHNHIILNTTDNVTMKKFRWQKGTKKSLENISDKHAEVKGAKIINHPLRNSHKKYDAWKQKNSFKVEVKNRLNFLLKQSSSLEDFQKKAVTLNLEVDFTGKYAKYKLLDQEQQRPIRERTLSKKERYSLEKIEEQLLKNEVTYSLTEIKKQYQEQQAKLADDFEFKLEIEAWQVKEITPQSIYVTVDFGIDQKGTVKIPARMLDQLDNGNFTAYLKKSDFFYFLNPDHSENNRFIRGTTLIKQLANKSGELLVTKNKNISRLDYLVDELNFLSRNNVTNSEQFKDLEERFISQLETTDNELENLDQKITKSNQIFGALVSYKKDKSEVKTAKEYLEQNKVDKTSDPNLFKKEIKELKIERDALKEHRDIIVKDYMTIAEVKSEIKEKEKKSNQQIR